MMGDYWTWIGFGVFVLAVLALDLGVFHRKSHIVGFREALGWTGVWVTLALLFGAGVWHFAGPQKGLEFFTGYLIEYSLSADNVFVFALIFSYFAVPAQWQHKVLFWGIIGALVMRLAMIGLGVALIHRFSWILYVFAAFLIFTGLKMVFRKGEELHPESNPVVRWFTKAVSVTPSFHQDRFFVRTDGRWVATPLMVVLVCVEMSDLVFAVDSIPAIFAITLDPFIVYTSNVFAILGLRSLYFALAGMMDRFHHLKTGLGVVLAFVGVKMCLVHTPYKIDTLVALGVVAAILAIAVATSLLSKRPAVAATAGRHSV
ncbi:MAG: TerC family protein [Verrucomicrobia bacterium]|nr:TerC family protein [Verrucomicrobiota bacterium]